MVRPGRHRGRRPDPGGVLKTGQRAVRGRKSRRWLLAAGVDPLVLPGGTSPGGRPRRDRHDPRTGAGSASAAPGDRGLAAVRRVWVIELENQGYQQSSSAPAADPYRATTLPRMGALLENYHAIGHASAANYIAQVPGQAPSPGTQADCPRWAPFAGDAVAGPYHQVLGEGCVYPAAVPTLGTQLSGAGRSWSAYLQDMGNDPARDHTVSTARGPACGHPATGALDHTRRAGQAISTLPATTGSPSSPRSPPARRSAPRTSCRSGRCPATWPTPAPPRRDRLHAHDIPDSAAGTKEEGTTAAPIMTHITARTRHAGRRPAN